LNCDDLTHYQPWKRRKWVPNFLSAPLKCMSCLHSVLGKFLGPLGRALPCQGSAVHGRQPGCEGECRARASASSTLGCCAGVPGDSALRVLGSRDGCCPSEHPFRCLLGAAAISELLCHVIPHEQQLPHAPSPLPHCLQQHLSEQALFLLRIAISPTRFPAQSLSSPEFHPSRFHTHRAPS